MKMIKMSLTGNEAAAWAAKCAGVKVCASFPMGPNQEVMETFQQFIDQGEAPGSRVIVPDNEKAASSMQIGLSRTGLRSIFCVTSEGILWAMSEIHYAASSRLPMMIVCPSRALEPPTTVYCDHDDFLSLRDMGWLMFYCENSQDVFDTILQAYKVSENEKVMLPVIVGYDGWETSHAASRVDMPEQAEIDRFLPPPSFIKPERDYLSVDWKERCSYRRYQEGFGGMEFMEIRYLQKKAEGEAEELIESTGRDYQDLSGSRHVGVIENYDCREAEVIIITMGIVYPTVKLIVKSLRQKGVRIGCLKVRTFRPFPARRIAQEVREAKLVITLDRNSIAALFHEVGSALYRYVQNGIARPMHLGKVVGVGGMPITFDLIGGIVEQGFETLMKGRMEKDLEWLPIKGTSYDPNLHVLAE